jgi:hypothetical protein
MFAGSELGLAAHHGRQGITRAPRWVQRSAVSVAKRHSDEHSPDPEPRQWIMDAFLRHAFPDELKSTRFLFPEVMEGIVPEQG